MMLQPPDIVLLSAEWRPRALIRAQLIEEGFEVVATNTWATMRRHLRTGSKPRLAFVDLKGLSDPQVVLDQLQVLMKPDRVLVLTATGTIPLGDVRRFGFHALSRPIVINDIVRAAAEAIRFAGASTPNRATS
jgi:ActR/RegA family two-component response regulator